MAPRKPVEMYSPQRPERATLPVDPNLTVHFAIELVKAKPASMQFNEQVCGKIADAAVSLAHALTHAVSAHNTKAKELIDRQQIEAAEQTYGEDLANEDARLELAQIES